MSAGKIEVSGIGIGVAQARKWLAEVNRLERRYGRLPTDEEILEAASNPKSSLHDFVFNVNEEEAARAYYIERVQWIMRNLAGIKATLNGGMAKFKLFVRTKDGAGRTVYEKTVEIQPDSAKDREIGKHLALEIASAKRRAEAWRLFVGGDRANAVLDHLSRAESIVRETSYGEGAVSGAA